MKKCQTVNGWYICSLKKIFLIMKITVFLLLSTFLQNYANYSYAQSTKLSLDYKNISLEKVLDAIENQSEFFFLYNEKLIDAKRKVSINAKHENVETILDRLFASTSVDYTIVDRKIVLAPDDIDAAVQQQRVVSGKITDRTGAILPGVTVVVKGTTRGTITDGNGDYTIGNLLSNSVLVFSFIGMRTQEVAVGSQTSINIVLEEETAGIEEVVVVGYGTQKKVNLTGAVEHIGSDAFENRPVTNITQMLQGVIPNLTIVLADGKPTRTASYEVRGVSSIGQGGSALVLIDGVEGDPSMLNPNDIESISVLKDAASASIYGARGAFGVVLISTKKPLADKISVNYTMNYAVKSPIAVPDFVTDGYTYAKLFNEAFSAWQDYKLTPSMILNNQKFSQEYLQELKRRSENGIVSPEVALDANGDYVYYGNTDWYDLLYKDNLTSVDHNISVSGSSNKLSYYISGRSNEQEGIYDGPNTDDFSIYNYRAKGSLEVTDWLTLSNNMEYAEQKYHQPMNFTLGANVSVPMDIHFSGHPTAIMFNPDGTLTMSGAKSVGGYLYGKSHEKKLNSVFKNTVGLNINLIENRLRIKSDFTFSNTDSRRDRIQAQLPYSNRPGKIEYLGTGLNDYRTIVSGIKYLASNIYGEFEKTFYKSHHLKVMSGFNYEESLFRSLTALRNGILFDDVQDISLAIGSSISTSGGYSKWRTAGIFYRTNYNFKDRYLLELNGRFDTSSKFPSDQQTAFFPSFSVGYRISNEPFWNISDKIISNLKLRGSYGSLGNGNVNPYSFLELFQVGQTNRVIMGTRPLSTSQPNVIPAGLTWESATTKNIGLDLGFVHDHLSITADIYERLTTDMYTPGLPPPNVFGTNVPMGNYADLKTTGWEMSVRWADQFKVAGKPLNFNARFVLGDNKSVVTKYNNPDKIILANLAAKERTSFYEGMVIGEVWGFTTVGLFQSEEDIATSADHSYIRASITNTRLPGDVKYKDLNNDGKINIGTNRVSDPGDLSIIGNERPRYTYGLQVGTDWNNFFFSGFLQGVFKQDWVPSFYTANYFGQFFAPYANIPKWHLNNTYTLDNPDLNAFLPRLRGASRTFQTTWVETRNLMNIGYIRLKNIQLGYNLPQILKVNVKLYVVGENIWSWSPLYKITRDFDPENTGGSDLDVTNGGYGDTNNYPMLKSYSFGISATF
jgi:TonB-linked SusC/RagA family outer membrane protein